VSPTAPAGLRDVLVVEPARCKRQSLERVALLPLAPEARITVLKRGRLPQAARGEGHVADSAGAPAPPLEVGARLSFLGEAPDEDILGEVERHEPELIVVAREPRSLRDRLFGSFPEWLARHSRVPVLVTELAARHRYQRILVGTDFSEVSRAALKLALRMALPGSGRVDVLHSYDTGYALTLHMTTASAQQLLAYYQQRYAEAERAMHDFLAPYHGAPVALDSVLTREDPRLALHRTASRQGVELLVVGKHRDTGIGHALLGSVAEACLRRSHYDVLVVPGAPVH
jgi:nucleotide-binding universal stress UspA family protein